MIVRDMNFREGQVTARDPGVFCPGCQTCAAHAVPL
jgi:hypothetical protein